MQFIVVLGSEHVVTSFEWNWLSFKNRNIMCHVTGTNLGFPQNPLLVFSLMSVVIVTLSQRKSCYLKLLYPAWLFGWGLKGGWVARAGRVKVPCNAKYITYCWSNPAQKWLCDHDRHLIAYMKQVSASHLLFPAGPGDIKWWHRPGWLGALPRLVARLAAEPPWTSDAGLDSERARRMKQPCSCTVAITPPACSVLQPAGPAVD